MDTDQLNRWLSLVANIGVLIGIILLLFEISQTQDIARAETRNQISLGITTNLSLIDRDTAEVMVRANVGEEIDPVDRILLGRWSESVLRYWENSDYQYKMGMYDETEYSAQKMTIKNTMMELFPGALIPHYCQSRLGYSAHFRSLIEEFLPMERCKE